MAYLLDTNLLLRRARLKDLQHQTASQAIERLTRSSERLHITSQNVIEFWNVLTRPAERNGFGMSPAEADAEARQLEAFFPLLPDTPAIYTHWRRLVAQHNVSGVQVHDARLVAVMLTHGITHLLTFNTDDFRVPLEVTAVHPRDVPYQPNEREVSSKFQARENDVAFIADAKKE